MSEWFSGWWRYWMGVLPDIDGALKLEPGSATDVLGLLLGVLVLLFTAYVAMRQIRIMNRQTTMMEEQGQLAKTQAALAIKQDKIIEEQLAKRPDLTIAHDGPADWRVGIRNNGNKPARDYYWELLLPVNSMGLLNIKRNDNEEVGFKDEDTDWISGVRYWRMGGFVDRPLYATRIWECLRLYGNYDWLTKGQEAFELPIKWRLNSEEGLVPATGYTDAKLSFSRDTT